MNEFFLSLLKKINFEKITDHPNILIAAAFWEEDRYVAAKTCYKYMRAIDDLIDNHKSAHLVIGDNEKDKFTESVQTWINMIKTNADTDTSNDELIRTIKRFHIPAWPLEAFAKAMIYDIDHIGFQTIGDFLEYAGGASVAPASIFVHLNGLVKHNDGYLPPVFDVKGAATPCAVFSYLVHIIRDFRKDQLNNLNYFADEEIAVNGLTHSDLRLIAEGGSIPQGFRNMIETYLNIADIYRKSTLNIMEHIFPLLEPRYRLSLQIIFNLYQMVYERIDIKKGSFTTEELNPASWEIKQCVYETIMAFRD
jgi:phytoene/squalene synthetase